MIYRLYKNYTNAGLSGQPNTVTIKVPIIVSFWYVIISGKINIPAANSPLRNHAFNFDVIRDVVKLCKI